ncbi:MAG: endonuclease, partial [Candidatus Cloacimonadaceae bacterium]
TGCYTSTNSWEPRDEEKGDVARMVLYMSVRYEGTDTTYDLEMQDITPTVGAYYGKLSTLLNWHVTDPPDSWERRRNNRIHERQGNRNPFVDHPEFVNQLWAPTATYATIMDSITFIANWLHAIDAQSYFLDVAYDYLFTNPVPGYDNLNVGYSTNRNVTVPVSDDTFYYRLRSFFTAGYSMYSNVVTVQYNTVPIELSSFTVNATSENNVLVQWTTQSETAVNGFYLFRAMENNLSEAVVVSPLIPGTNTSQTHDYSFLDEEIYNSGTYYYWLQAVYLNGVADFYGPVFLQITDAVDDTVSPSILPELVLSRVYPNPFRQSAAIDFELQKAAAVELKVYNLKGQAVKTLYTGIKASGQHTLSWDGRDNHGVTCAPGIYFIRLHNGTGASHKKIIRF